MNNKKRFLLGFLSSLLFACGFAGIASRMDPMNETKSPSLRAPMNVADNCAQLCAAELS